MEKLFLKAFVLFGLVSSLYAHSWLHCTDYRIQSKTDEETFDSAKCKGFPRGWKDCCKGTGLGVDRGYDFKPQTGGVACENTPSSPLTAAYDDAAPMAKYSPGQKVCLAWPPKNHVAASCDNPNIPDNGLKIYMIGPDTTQDRPIAQATLVKDFGKNSGPDKYEGFQNCPKYCDDHDKALCTGCFNVPKNVQIGKIYTFYWWWSFNSPTDHYANCWEAEIVEGSGSNDENNKEEDTPCTVNDDCKSGVCTINGFCKKSGIQDSDHAINAAIAMSVLFAVALLAIVAVFFYRDKVADALPYSIKSRTK